MKVVGPRVLIKKVDPPETKSSVIQVVSLTERPSLFGLVIAVGTIRENIKIGDMVCIGPYSGTEVSVEINNVMENLHILNEDEILAVVEV